MCQTELEHVKLFRCGKTARGNVGDRRIGCRGKNSVPRKFLKFSGVGLNSFRFCLMNISVYRFLKNVEVKTVKDIADLS